jgi:NADH-quinone oxidoreductase subunit L
MAGPTPTSALIHAATMVTAGVYLIARTHTLFELAPTVLAAVAFVGVLTLLVSGFSALAQHDIKRVLAYSTISQIGYMFLALGVGAWGAAIFHFMTHAFFKALLFLAAGIVIQAVHHEHDMLKMGGLRRELPIAFWCFLIGGSALAGLPLITAGFFSKDLIIWEALASPRGDPRLWAAAIFGVFLTSLYTFRLIFLVFFGPLRIRPDHRPGFAMSLPVIVLAALSLAAGFVQTPHALGGVSVFYEWIGPTLPLPETQHEPRVSEVVSQAAAAGAFAAGLLLAWFYFLRKPELSAALLRSPAPSRIHQFWRAGWGFDWLYDRLFIRPIEWLARVNRSDFVDSIYAAIARAAELSYRFLRLSENGYVRWYAASIGAGAAILIAIVLLI